MTGNTDMHLLVTDTLKKVGAWIRKPVSIWCDHYLPHASHLHLSHLADALLRIELIRQLIVACGMLSHSSSMAVKIFWIL
jgi:hypothetical protein